MSILDACQSTPHRTALRLLGVALGANVDDDLLRDLQSTDTAALAEIVNAHHLHTILYSARQIDPRIASSLPSDFWLYLEEMQKANWARNSRGVAQLGMIAQKFANAHISGIVLKGGAGLLDPIVEPPSSRFVSDLDILVAPEMAQRAQEIMTELGGQWQSFHAVTSEIMHHLPPIIFEEFEFPVELHLRVGQPIVSGVLSNETVEKSSIPTDLKGLSVPSLVNRYLHHVLHTARGRGDGDDIYLRSIIDHSAFMKRLSVDQSHEAYAKLERHGLAHHADRLDALTTVLTQNAPPIIARAEQIWLHKALGRFGNPRSKKYRVIFNGLFGFAYRFVTSKPYRAYYLAAIKNNAERSRVLAHYKQRIGKIR